MSESGPISHAVTCLSIDVAKSTQTGNQLSPARRFAYQSAIIDLIDKYIPELGFIEYQAKFTGDGWLIFSPYNEDIDKLVVLGKTVCHLYPAYVADIVSGFGSFEPAVRACICSGQDYPKMVKQQDGSAIKDWLGDSARRASSLASCAYAHELLVDQPVNDRIELIFKSEQVDKSALPDSMLPKHDRERSVWRVGTLKHTEMDPGEGAAPYVSYLNWTGQEKESAQLITAAIKAVLQVRDAEPAQSAPIDSRPPRGSD
jgi:class 3 adenylate cyclase